MGNKTVYQTQTNQPDSLALYCCQLLLWLGIVWLARLILEYYFNNSSWEWVLSHLTPIYWKFPIQRIPSYCSAVDERRRGAEKGKK